MMNLHFDQLNWLAIPVAAAAYFMLGGLWYSQKLFAGAWMKEMQYSPEKIEAGKGKGMAGKFAGAIALALFMAFVLALLIRATAPQGAAAVAGKVTEAVQGRSVFKDALSGGWLGLLVGLGFTATAVGTNYLFEGRSFRLFLINAGYPIAGAVVMGLILGAWR